MPRSPLASSENRTEPVLLGLTPRTRKRKCVTDRAAAQKSAREERHARAAAKRKAIQDESKASKKARASVTKDAMNKARRNATRRQSVGLPPKTQRRSNRAGSAACAELSEAMEAKQAELEEARSEIAELSAVKTELEEKQERTQLELDAQSQALDKEMQRASFLESQLKSTQQHNCELECQLLEAEVLRKRLHNTIAELKGNIRVFARVRPANGKEKVDSAISFVESDPERRKLLVMPTAKKSVDGGTAVQRRVEFQFDRALRPSSTQAEIFEEVSHLVQSALDGYRVCIFAYGQTGSGKTYTMEGGNTLDSAGIIPRSVDLIFERTSELQAKGWKVRLEASVLEIYNETLRDLGVGADSGSVTSSLSERSGAENHKLEIKHSVEGGTHVTNLTNVEVKSATELRKLMLHAQKLRAVGSTSSNEHSSRSHSVFQLRIRVTNEEHGEARTGLLSLIDLAGSERLGKSGAQSTRLKETQAINKSLSSLGDVIFALSSRAKHVPFRNSKLTYLLKNSLGGDSKTLMLVCVAPSAVDVAETLCSLRFATKVNSCEIGTARRHTVRK